MSQTRAFQDLVTEAATLSSATSALGWDQETYLPPAGAAWRAQQLSWLTGRRHELITSESWERAIDDALAKADNSDRRTLGSLREMKRRFERARRLPTELVERQSSLASQAKHSWATAREKDDFASFAPFLEKLIGIAREKAELWGYAGEPYDALLEGYEPGASTRTVSSAFDAITGKLREIATAAVARSASCRPELPQGPYPIEQQARFNQMVAASLGFDFDCGRIDTTTHPFCTTLGPKDVRLTTRYDLNDFTSSLFGVMHEAGHGLYEQGLSADDFGTPAGEAASLGIHESQSRLWENHIGRSSAFWEKWFPIAAEHFPRLNETSFDKFLQYVHRSEFSFIRVESDEATYDLHILLRFELERQLVRGELAVKDIPDAWNSAFSAAFGTVPATDREGCLQDIHWAMGGLGYFPTYTLGNLNAAQLFETARQSDEIAKSIDAANYLPLLEWLRKEVHAHGSSMTPAEIMQSATGDAVNPSAYLQHLENRYLG